MGREVISSPAEKEKAGNNPGLFCMAFVVYGLWGMGYGVWIQACIIKEKCR